MLESKCGLQLVDCKVSLPHRPNTLAHAHSDRIVNRQESVNYSLLYLIELGLCSSATKRKLCVCSVATLHQTCIERKH